MPASTLVNSLYAHRQIAFESPFSTSVETDLISENIPYPYRLSDSMTFGGHESNNNHSGVQKTPCPIKESGVFSK